ncbi:MAG: hypothetical protein HQ502_01825 [Alphaproteobacteria bacterium]|nr:hypothetical protein [Alphaproteobacteria bacterium]
MGYRDVFVPALLRPARMLIRARLWRLAQPELVLTPPTDPGRVTVMLPGMVETAHYLSAFGYRPVGGPKIGQGVHQEARLAVRVDIFDRLARLAHTASKAGPAGAKQFQASHEMLSLLGRGREGLDDVLRDLGYGGDGAIEARRYYFRRPKQKRQPQRGHKTAVPEVAGPDARPASPFAELRHLLRRS